ncbi:hypothetical protein FOMPIDRAFT_1128232 [Fomitopsis schrenkii]|uniref:RNase H type-1 domain-containing protein n=1 Tax=Fomitopsis schrenkii TaxID=2126942 RepID=S8FGQ0_FOMSC|nr:hypothetical protein FOMPIDRAFT_1128232 [Fomitopsis schrenkii]
MHDRPPAVRPKKGIQVQEEDTTFYIIGKKEKGEDNAARDDGLAGSLTEGYAYKAFGSRANGAARPETEEHTYEPGILGEITAAILATDRTPGDAPLHLICTSTFIQKALIEKLGEWEDHAWMGVENAPFIYTLVGKLRKRCAVTTIRKAKGHQDWSQVAAARQEWKDRAEESDPTLQTRIQAGVDDEFNITGMRISSISQAWAYAGIRALKEGSRRRTELRMDRTLVHIERTTERKPPAKEIWRGIKHKDISPSIADFLWKTMHDAHRCGSFWTKIPRYEDRGQCHHCGVEESMEHILTGCRANGQSEVWTLTEKLWVKTNLPWPGITMADTLSTPLRRWRRDGEKRPQCGAERLWRIIVTEATFLIWKLRCERVISHSEENEWQHTRTEIQNRWMAALTKRMRNDVASTHWRNGSLAIKKTKIMNTWHDVLKDRDRLPKDWISKRVLVGIAPVEDTEPD